MSVASMMMMMMMTEAEFVTCCLMFQMQCQQVVSGRTLHLIPCD